MTSLLFSVTPYSSIVFPAVTHVRALITKRSQQQNYSTIPVVVDCQHLLALDYTAAAQFSDMLDEFSSRQQPFFWLCPNDRVAHTIKAVAGDLFVRISGAHQVMEDQRDSKEEEKEKEETDSLVQVETEQ